jgi:membrane-associated protease RseP (regulator of RpoE activity)
MANFVVYDLVFLALFTLAVVIFLYKRRRNLKRQGLLYLYRTKVGIKVMDWFVNKFGKILRPMQYLVIGMGYALMIAMIYLLGNFVYLYSKPGVAELIKIPPILPLFPYATDLFKVDFLPPFYFTYWIVIIAIVAISHEFSHGIFARLNKIKVHSTGFGFLGPFLAAFVEPDEKKMQKAKKFDQLSILAAGTFANILMTIVFGLIFLVFFVSSFTPAGFNFNVYPMSIVDTSQINSVNGNAIQSVGQIEGFLKNGSNKITTKDDSFKSYLVPNKNLKEAVQNKIEKITVYDDAPAINANLSGPILGINGKEIKSRDDLIKELGKYSPGETVEIKSFEKGETVSRDIKLADLDGKAYLGVGFAAPPKKGISGFLHNMLAKIKDPSIYYKPNWDGNFVLFIYNLLWWTVLINLSVALVNMLPVGIFDGGRFFYLTIWGLTGSENAGKKAFSWATKLILLALLWVTIVWVFSLF